MVSKKSKKKKKIDEKRRRIFDFLCNNPCSSCGETDPLVLEFDHLSDKKTDISKLIRSTCSWRQLKVELDKCVVLCSNCHRRKTHKEARSYRYRFFLASLAESAA